MHLELFLYNKTRSAFHGVNSLSLSAPPTSRLLLELVELDCPGSRVVRREGEVNGKAAHVRYLGATVVRLELVVRVREDDDFGQRVETQGVVVAPVHGLCLRLGEGLREVQNKRDVSAGANSPSLFISLSASSRALTAMGIGKRCA